MKTLRLLSMLFIASALSFGFASCGDDDEDEPAPVETNYASVIPGHWSNIGLSNDLFEALGFFRDGSIVFTDLVENDWGVIAKGTYTLNGNKIAASYTDVDVDDSNYKPGTYHGFTDGKPKMVTYFIQSCDGKKLVLKDEAGVTKTYEKYNDVK